MKSLKNSKFVIPEELSKLEDIRNSFSFIKSDEERVPIPSPDFLKELHTDNPNVALDENQREPYKYKREYDAYCKWVALPKEQRKPQTIGNFEEKWHLPKGYTPFFHQRKDFQQNRLMYFWEWMMDKLPDVVNAIYRRAMGRSSKDASIFVELIAKHINLNKPSIQVSPMMLVGVPQERINDLFVPKSYRDIKDITPDGGK